MKKFLPCFIAGLFVAWIVSALATREEGEFHLREFGKLPVLLNGRVQPMDSVGRNALRQLRNTQTVPLEGNRTLGATEWLLEVLAKPGIADTRRVFRVDNDEVKSLLGLPAREKHFAFTQIEPAFAGLEKQARRITGIESAQRTVFERHAYNLYGAVILYQRLKLTLVPPGIDNFTGALAAFQAAIPGGVEAARLERMGLAHDTNALNTLAGHLAVFNRAAQFGYALCVPPAEPGRNQDDWKNMGAALMEAVRGEPMPPAVPHLAAMMTAFRHGDAPAFNQALGEYRAWLDRKMIPEAAKGRQEFAFNFLSPFYKATVIYVGALLAGLAFWLFGAPWLRQSAFSLVAMAWALHTLGLLARMFLEGRPPVTNLYSSAVFVGWGSVLLGLFLERAQRDGVGSVAASVVGFVTQIIAHNLALGGDTKEMMRAVLDSNFWLATHVITITLGYSAVFVAGLLGVIYVLRGVFTTALSEKTASAMGGMAYGVICFATLFTFAGTVLGGIWADQSWGRFWGWDPKENGALMIFLWCAVILHARWGGMVRHRGVMNMAIAGNIITSWSWFGTNMLGVGLHSYGFMEAGFKWLVLFVASQLLVIGIGLVPLHLWRSFRSASAPPASSLAPAA